VAYVKEVLESAWFKVILSEVSSNVGMEGNLDNGPMQLVLGLSSPEVGAPIQHDHTSNYGWW